MGASLPTLSAISVGNAEALPTLDHVSVGKVWFPLGFGLAGPGRHVAPPWPGWLLELVVGHPVAHPTLEQAWLQPKLVLVSCQEQLAVQCAVRSYPDHARVGHRGFDRGYVGGHDRGCGFEPAGGQRRGAPAGVIIGVELTRPSEAPAGPCAWPSRSVGTGCPGEARAVVPWSCRSK